MPSWSSASASSSGGADERVLRRFLETSRRAEIVALLNAAGSEAEIARVVVEELGETLQAEVAFLLATDPGQATRAVIGQTGLRPGQAASVARDPMCAAALEGTRAHAPAGRGLPEIGACRVALSPWTAESGRRILIGVARLYAEDFEPSEVALLEAVTDSAGLALVRSWLASERDRHAGAQAALIRAAKALNASLVREEVLETLCEEIAGALGADVVAVYFVHEDRSVRAVAGRGIGPEALGDEQPDDALGVSVIRSGLPEVLPGGREIDLGLRGVAGVRCGLAVPASRRAEVDGALVAGFLADRPIGASDIELLTGFAELAGLAYRNADEHTAVQRAATLDSLTGCLNHGAFQSRLREEIARAERTGRRLTLISLDFDDFKSVNDRFGHLAGDRMLRTLADILRDAVRSYDQVGRLGGDEFMLLLPATEAEESARRVLDRALEALARARHPGGTKLTVSAGVADWRPGESADELVERADSSLLDAKVVNAVGGHRPRRGELSPSVRRSADGEERRHLQRLLLAGTLGTRLARLLDERAIVEAAMADLHTQLGYEHCLVVRCHADGTLGVVATARPEPVPGQLGPAPLGAGDAGLLEASARALAERQPVLINHAEPATDSGGPAWGLVVRSELAVPVLVSSAQWGALALRSSSADAFGAADARLLQRVADHVGSALRTAEMHHHLEQNYLGTTAALAAALEAKDHYTADHARSIADLAVELGRALGLEARELTDLRYGALFHDIGKIAIPDAILNKTGPLDEAEMTTIRQHPLVGERILAPVAFLSGIRRIVRHDHERWDGAGYPDGLSGTDIPLGARIVLAVDAYHAMTSDRPYRKALSLGRAREELQRHAGTQFDPEIVGALLTMLGPPAGAE